MYSKFLGRRQGKRENCLPPPMFFPFDLGTQVRAVRIVLKISTVSSLNPPLYALLCTPWRDRTEHVFFFQ